VTSRLPAYASAALVAIMLAGCDSSSPPVTAASPPPTTTKTTQTTPPPGQGKPTVTIGDKNYTEQFVLGQLYYQALQAQGFAVQINQNIGPLQVTMQALAKGDLGMYPEYLDTWNSQVARNPGVFKTRHSAYAAAQGYALSHGLELLTPTPFSDTNAIGVTYAFAERNHLHTIGDLRKVDSTLTIGGPIQFQQEPTGLPAMESGYGLIPGAFKPLEIGYPEYKALDQNLVQAADVNTTDAELTTGNYKLLADPLHVFGVGNVVPVVSLHVLEEEGPAFAETVNRVTALLTLEAIRQLNAAVDLAGVDPASAARRFLVTHGLVPPSSSVG
jgi:osmoprotectant transport system substrate-binding protein